MKLAARFGRNVRQLRRARGLTIEDLAHEAGVSYSYVGELERGQRNPSLKVIERLAYVLQVPAARLLA